jgi:hypothetical protein
MEASTAAPDPRPAPPAGRTSWLLFAAGLFACFVYLGGEIYARHHLGFPLDDSFIHLQFARNLAAGHGLSYNPGQIVTGSTAPLWTALLALLFLLPGSVFLWVKIFGIALYLAGVDATRRLATELGLSPGLATLAAALTLATGPLVWSALSGMEVPLFVLLSLWGTILHLRERAAPERPPLSLPVFALAILARPEGVLLVLVAALDRLVVFRRRPAGGPADGPIDGPIDGAPGPGRLTLARPRLRPLARGLGLAGLGIAGSFLFYRLAGGSFLPTTFAVKGNGVQRYLPDLQYLYVILGILFRPQPYMLLLAGGGVARLVANLGTPRDRGLLPALWTLGLPLGYSLMSPLGRGLIAGNFGRYYFPLFPFVVLLGVLGLEGAARSLGETLRRGPGRLTWGVLLSALLLWPTVAGLSLGAGRYAQNVANVEDGDVRAALWLRPRLPAGALLAVNDIGALKYLLPNPVVDLVGISSPDLRREVAADLASGRARSWEQAMLAALARRQPDYLVIFPTWFPAVDHLPGFRLLQRFEVPNNVTMGGDQIGIYATPWTRHPLRPLPGDAAAMPSMPATPETPAR